MGAIELMIKSISAAHEWRATEGRGGGSTFGIPLNPRVLFLDSPSSVGNQLTTLKELSECIALHDVAMEKIRIKKETVINYQLVRRIWGAGC